MESLVFVVNKFLKYPSADNVLTHCKNFDGQEFNMFSNHFLTFLLKFVNILISYLKEYELLPRFCSTIKCSLGALQSVK